MPVATRKLLTLLGNASVQEAYVKGTMLINVRLHDLSLRGLVRYVANPGFCESAL